MHGKPETACRRLLLSFVCMQATRKANTFLPTGISFSLCVRKHCGEKEGTHSVAFVALYRFTIYLFLTLKRAFIYSGTPPYSHIVNIFFGRHAKTSISVFSCKETLVNTTTTTTTTTSLFSIYTILYRCYRLK